MKKEDSHMPKNTVGMIGLGIMGSAMSANLVKAGFDVLGFDPVSARRRELKRAGGHAAKSGRDVAGRSPIIITSNDLAGAWALRPDGQPMLPLTPGDPRQREFAFRAGVNIVMYTLTGNYKADQVHAPALIERLGQ